MKRPLGDGPTPAQVAWDLALVEYILYCDLREQPDTPPETLVQVMANVRRYLAESTRLADLEKQ